MSRSYSKISRHSERSEESRRDPSPPPGAQDDGCGVASTIQINERPIQVRPDKSIFELATSSDIRIPTSCLGKGKCRECLIEILAGQDSLSAPTQAEQHLQENFRLSCQTYIKSETGNIRCQTLRRGSIRVEDKPLDFCAYQVPPFDPSVYRQGQKVFLDGEAIDDYHGYIYGVAVDLGTTTVAMRLVDLESGKVLAVQSFENPQRFAGSDVLARVKFDSNHKGQLLRRVLCGYMSRAIGDFGVDSKLIYEVVVAANTAMRDIFFGIDVYSVGQMPYKSLTEHELLQGKRQSTAVVLSATKALLPINPRGRVYGLPLIGSHVGGDVAAGLLAINLADESRLICFVDIGTNTEIVIGNKDNIFAASCPAGPAFEGGRIQCGVPALDGAIERVYRSQTGDMALDIIGNALPIGICGSGLIDLLSYLKSAQQMNEVGRFTDDLEKFMVSNNPDIFITESDISELAQAKAATVSGLHLVLKHYGIKFSDIEVIYLAGGFAKHIDIASAMNIGLIPKVDVNKYIQLGNSSLEGAYLALTSLSLRNRLEHLVKTVNHVELEQFEEFFQYFVKGVQFLPFETLDFVEHAYES